MFDSSFHINWHTFRKEFWQILWLAGPGVAISAILTAFAIVNVVGYGDVFDWWSAMMLGSVLAATDPVAVVALLKEVGASKKLGTLIEGESLLNDGTAMVLFTGMFRMAVGEGMNVGDLTLLFVRLSVGGPLLGVVFGVIMCIWLKRVFHDDVLEFSLTFITAYFTFYVAEETPVKVSGILALCGLGLYMSAWGKNHITAHSEESVHNVWSYAAYISETMIFTMSGIIIGHNVLMSSIVVGKDYGLLVLFYICMYVIRIIQVVLSYPILKYYAYGITWRDMIIIIHGGMLRGALGLILALIISVEPSLSHEIRHISLFLMAGTALFTLIFNASTTGILLVKLGLTKTSKMQETILKEVLQTVRQETDAQIEELQKVKYIKHAQWNEVKAISGLEEFTHTVLTTTTGGKQILKDLKSQGEDLGKFNEMYSQALKSQDPYALEMEHRHRFLQTLKSNYIRHFDLGQCGNKAVTILVASAERSLDNDSKPLDDWNIIKDYIQGGPLLNTYKALKSAPLVGRIFMRLTYSSLANSYDVASTFIECHEKTRDTMKEIIKAEEWLALEKIVDESKREVKKARKFIRENVTNIFAEITRDLQTRKAAQAVLNRQLEVVSDFFEHGVINEKEFKIMNSLIESRMFKLLSSKKVKDIPPLRPIIDNIPFFETFPKESLDMLVDSAKTLLLNEGEYLFKIGDAALGVYIILRGQVKEVSGLSSEYVYQHDSGSLAGIHHLLGHVNRNLTAGIAQSMVYAAFIPKSKILDAIQNPQTEERLWKISAPLLITLMPDQFEMILNTLDFERIKQMVEICNFRRYEAGDLVDLSTSILLMYGEIKVLGNEQDLNARQARVNEYNEQQLRGLETDQGITYRAFCYIPYNPDAIVVNTKPETIIFEFGNSLQNTLNERQLSLEQAVDLIYENRIGSTDFGLKRQATLAPVVLRKRSFVKDARGISLVKRTSGKQKSPNKELEVVGGLNERLLDPKKPEKLKKGSSHSLSSELSDSYLKAGSINH